MSKDEKILRKVGKLLELYGVKPEEKEKFLLDLQDKKYDEEGEAETVEETNLEESKEEEKVEEKDGKEVESTEEEKEDKVEEKTEEVAEEGEEKETETETETTEVEETGDTEQGEGEEEKETETEEESVEEKHFDYEAEIRELKNSNEGLSARVKTLEDIVAKLGVDVEEKEDKTIGATSKGNAIDENYNSAFDEINRKRVGH